MTTAASPVISLGELARERSASNASKHHPEHHDRSEPRSVMTLDYTNGGNGMRYPHQPYGENHVNEYSEDYHNQKQQSQQQPQQSQQPMQQQQPPPSSYAGTNGYTHHAPTSNGSSHTSNGSSHYSHESAAYLPPPIHTAPFGNGSTGNNGVHPHAQTSMHASFASPTSPALSPSPLMPLNTHNLYQQQHQQQHGQYGPDYSQGSYHSPSYHAHHASYPPEHHQHPLSPSTDGNNNHFYPSYPIPVGGKLDGVNGNSNVANGNGSYSSSSSSSAHYPRNNSYSNHHPESPGAMMGMPTTPENMANDGHARDPNMLYSASTPSPTSPQAPMAPRSKRRSEVYASHESPFFYPTQQHYRLMSMDQSTIYSCKIAAKIDRGFFLASNDWTCYRRNYFQISASFSIVGLDTSIYSEVPCLLESKDEVVQVQKFLICIGAQIQNGEKTIELVQHTPKRDKGPQITPSPTPVRAGGELGMSSPGSNPNVITFERVQFKTATANNGKRRAAQQYYQVRVDLFAETERGELIMVATSFSAPLVVRGRSPGHYADNDEGIPGSSTQSMDERYSYRNDSISSSSNGGGPIGSTVGSDYSYYPNYSYGSSYQYQSLGSASHMAAQSNDHGYYERHGSESYPTSPLSPVNQHPGAIDTSLPPHPHPYMAPQVQHGFSPASVSPDMYSAPGFITPDGGNRLPHLQGHPQNGHYPYGSSAYAQYPQQQQEQHDQYQAQQGQQDDDHEVQLAALQIHSPVTPSSPVMSPVASRRQSFSSSLSAKKCDRSSVGPTRKSRSISISGITKRAPSKTRTSRTIPTTPTKELVKGLGISNDRIPELEESQA